MKVKNFLTMLLVSCIGISSISGCGSTNGSKVKTLDDYKKAGKIVMGTNAAFPPFEYYEDNEIKGFDIEISKKVAEKLGVELVIEDMTFDGLINALNSSKIDFIAAGMTATEDKKKNVNFSQAYYNSGQAIIVKKDNTEIKSKSDLINKKIGVQIATTGAEEAKTIEGAIISEYNEGAIAIMDMKSGKVDAVILDFEPAKKFAEQNDTIIVLDEMLTEEEYSLAVRKEENELKNLIDDVLIEMEQNGEYDKLIEEFFQN